MKDINLFSSHVNEKKDTIKKQSGKRMFIFIGMVALLVIVAVWGFMQWDIMSNANQIKKLQARIDDPSNKAKVAEYNALKKEADSIASYGQVLYEIDKAVVIAETITAERIKEIAEVTPKDLNITNMTMGKEALTIAGECEINDSVAEFEYNLKQLDFMESVFVSNIIRADEEKGYSFAMVCVVKGGVE